MTSNRCEVCGRPLGVRNRFGVCSVKPDCRRVYNRRAYPPKGGPRLPMDRRERLIGGLDAGESRRVLVGALTAVEEAFRDLGKYAAAGRAAAARCRRRIDDIYTGNFESFERRTAEADKKAE